MAHQNNEQNLKVLSSEEARIQGQKGGIASGAARRKKRLFRDIINEVMTMDVDDPEMHAHLEALGLDPTFDNAIIIKMAGKSAAGDVEAARFVRDTRGEKPTDVHTVLSLDAAGMSAADLSALSSAELEAMVAAEVANGDG